MPNKRAHVFICYSRKDDKWRRRVQTTLSPLLRTGEVKTWADRDISPGGDWRREIDQALSGTAVGLVLASADALASDFITQVELPALVAASERGELTLLWVLVSDCLWQATPLARYQSPLAIDRSLEALSAHRQDAAMVQLCFAIRDAVADQRQRAPTVPSPRPMEATSEATRTAVSRAAPSDAASPIVSADAVIAQANQRMLQALAEDLAAAARQVGEIDNAVQRGRLERQIEGIEAEIRRLAG